MIITTATDLPTHRVVRVLGLVVGSTIRARHLGKDLLAVFKHIVGGEIEEYTKMLGESREQALDRMRAHASDLGANAVIGMRFASSYVMHSASEILAYGTAVVLEPATGGDRPA